MTQDSQALLSPPLPNGHLPPCPRGVAGGGGGSSCSSSSM